MKLFLGIFVVAASATFAAAQQSPPQPTAPLEAKIVAELAAVHPYVATENAPFSAEEVNESVQTLADGNRIVRKSSGKMYRNTAGLVRREMTGGLGATMGAMAPMGSMGTLYSTVQGISIATPATGQSQNTNLKTARVVEVPVGQTVTVTAAGSELTPEQKRLVEERVKTAVAGAPVAIVSQGGQVYATGAVAGFPLQGGTYGVGGQSTKYDVKTEELGTRDFEGVSAQGTRRTTVIPADSIGNERPIEIVYERWFSKDLGLVVYSKNTDPRFGEQTYKLTNIVRAEPDPSLFTVPTGYKTFPAPSAYKSYGDATTVYRIATTEAEKAAPKIAAEPKKP
ncbi:MAG: hypothetical protein IPI64_02230 [Chloracidobacterium sp.]|nr:hypothetical protein [Chloracidobacterium sp.]